MEIEWKYVKSLDNTTVVKTFLKNHNIDLPAELVKMIESFNGGRPSNKTVVTSTGHEYVFKSLLSYNSGDIETIYDIYPVFEKMNLFPIGSDSAGNYVCYDLNSKLMVLYIHEEESTERITLFEAMGILGIEND